MRDYAELIKDLRESAEWSDRLAVLMGRDVGDSKAPLMRKAADAIEELLAENKAIKQSNKDAAMRNKLLCDEISRMKENVPHWTSVEELLAERTAFWVDTQPHLDDFSYKKDGMSYYCSNCHHRAGKYKHRSYKFCPWCGAKIVPKEMAVRNED